MNGPYICNGLFTYLRLVEQFRLRRRLWFVLKNRNSSKVGSAPIFASAIVVPFHSIVENTIINAIAIVTLIAGVNGPKRPVTIRNEVAKVMFSQACVCPWGGGVPGPGVCLLLRGCLVRGVSALGGGVCSGGCLLCWVGIPACTEADPPQRDGYCCGRYASYWNAFLFLSPVYIKRLRLRK